MAATSADDNILRIDENTPFYLVQPTEEIQKVFEQESKRIHDKLFESAQVTSGPFHVGSSAIKGMPGSPVVDLALTIKGEFPPSEKVIASLAEIGYEYNGPAPHDPDQDTWFMGGDAPKGSLGRVMLHIAKDGGNFCRDAKAYVDYVNSHPEAFEAYKAIKLEGGKIGLEKKAQKEKDGEANDEGMSPQTVYKLHKHKVVTEIMEKAKEWQKNQE